VVESGDYQRECMTSAEWTETLVKAVKNLIIHHEVSKEGNVMLGDYLLFATNDTFDDYDRR
jgi:hypothetical protein